jgi:hypothetical protein
MSDYQFQPGRITVGIDVGWSEKSASCALAIGGLVRVPSGSGWKGYPCPGGRIVAVKRFRLTDLLEELPRVICSMGSASSSAIFVLDGPVGPAGAPARNRTVDTLFASGRFHQRVQPVPIESASGAIYVSTTEAIVQVISREAAGQRPAQLWSHAHTGGVVLCETHPTVGLALLVSPQDPSRLPSRRRALRLPIEGAVAVRAKSDWYWQIGAGAWIADQVFGGCEDIRTERDHERVAGLYCLAVAEQIRMDPRRVVTCGSPDGVYVFLSAVHPGWQPENFPGVVSGQVTSPPALEAAAPHCEPEVFEFVLHPSGLHAPSTGGQQPGVVSSAAEPGDDEDDGLVLVLQDPGGIWTQHNRWLVDLESIVALETLDDWREIILLKRSRREDGTQWISLSARQTPSQLVQRRGRPTDAALDASNRFLIPIRILGSHLSFPE